MPKYVFAYRGGEVEASPEAQEAVMQKWMTWFGELGASVIDGGNPFGASRSVGGGGASQPLGGYSIIDATDLDDAEAKAQGCPVLGDGGSVDVYEAIEMG